MQGTCLQSFIVCLSKLLTTNYARRTKDAHRVIRLADLKHIGMLLNFVVACFYTFLIFYLSTAISAVEICCN